MLGARLAEVDAVAPLPRGHRTAARQNAAIESDHEQAGDLGRVGDRRRPNGQPPSSSTRRPAISGRRSRRPGGQPPSSTTRRPASSVHHRRPSCRARARADRRARPRRGRARPGVRARRAGRWRELVELAANHGLSRSTGSASGRTTHARRSEVRCSVETYDVRARIET